MVTTSENTCKNQDTSESDVENWRRKCGCIRTSEKLKQILTSFPSPPPPTPCPTLAAADIPNDPKCPDTCISGYCYYATRNRQDYVDKPSTSCSSWRVVSEIVQLVQLSVTATALAIYYLIYCYMQLVYYTLQSAIYFHNADGPMKITIGVVTVTSIVVGFNLLLRMERLLGVLY